MNGNEIRNFIYGNYYKPIGFFEEISYCSLKLLKKERLLLLTNKFIKNILAAPNAKEHYESFLRKKNRKPVKKSEIITYQLKIFETTDIKPDIKNIQKPHKLFRTIRKGEKVYSNNSL